MLIEILVSAMVLTIASAGVVMLLQTTTKTQAEQRNSTEAYALAQEDQARLTSMRLATLNRLDQTRTVTLNKTNFSVRSRGVFVNDSTSTPSCGEGTSTADYVEITSTVTWNGMDPGEKAKIVSILSPSNGSLDPNNGTIAFSVKTQLQEPVANVYVSGGSGAFGGYTDAAGCVVFTDLPAGNYTATVNGTSANVVNKNGDYSEQKQVPIVGGDTKTVAFEFDRPGTIQVGFSYRVGSSGELKSSSADSLFLYHPNMDAGVAQVLGTPGGTRQASFSATPLYPFTSTYLVHPGSCTTNNANPAVNPAAASNVLVTRGGTANLTLQLPAFTPTVWTGDNEANKGSALANADVWIRDPSCLKSGLPLTRRYTTNSLGQLSDPGLPWGTYHVCVDTEPGANTTGVRRQLIENVSVKDLLNSTSRNFYLGSGAGTMSTSGSCWPP
ncbi:MAG: hypothetical protein QOE75_162 [Solirubrobacterales bacterium]|nr:hypothetical protein [Solirubrobacterales bacterium]